MVQVSKVRTYDPKQCVVFRVTTDKFGGLSNMASNFPLGIDGIKVRSSEALYQACRFPHLPKVQAAILNERSPMTAKMQAKHFASDTRADWAQVRVKVMRWCIRVKLAQNWAKFGLLLSTTDEKPIVEESLRDAFWGAKPSATGTLVGINALGRLLMDLRQELRVSTQEQLSVVAPLKIKDFLLLGRPIGVVDGAAAGDATVRASQIGAGGQYSL